MEPRDFAEWLTAAQRHIVFRELALVDADLPELAPNLRNDAGRRRLGSMDRRRCRIWAESTRNATGAISGIVNAIPNARSVRRRLREFSIRFQAHPVPLDIGLVERVP